MPLVSESYNFTLQVSLVDGGGSFLCTAALSSAPTLSTALVHGHACVCARVQRVCVRVQPVCARACVWPVRSVWVRVWARVQRVRVRARVQRVGTCVRTCAACVRTHAACVYVCAPVQRVYVCAHVCSMCTCVCTRAACVYMCALCGVCARVYARVPASPACTVPSGPHGALTVLPHVIGAAGRRPRQHRPGPTGSVPPAP